MNPPIQPIRVLTREACADALRRRIVPIVAVVSILSLLAVDSCTQCSPSITTNGQVVETLQLAGWSSAIIYLVLSLWTMLLAGILASDHLATTLEDGSAALVLSRPVSRSAFALSRLAGALAIAFFTGAVLLGGATFLIHLRIGADLGAGLGAAAWAALACASGTVIVSALAMLTSLYLPQAATVIVVMAGIGVVTGSNAFAQFADGSGGFIAAINGYGPPLYASVALALAPWTGVEVSASAGLGMALRMALWTAISVATLVVVFRTEEIR